MKRRQFLGLVGSGLLAAGMAPPARAGEDEALLDEIERAAFRYFWEQAPAATGQVKDRARASGSDDYAASSIAATGFGLSALCIGDHRGYGDPAPIRERVRTTLTFLADTLPQEHGFYYHFVDMNTGARKWGCELSTIDSALLLCGVLTARQHFKDDADVCTRATRIFERVDWPWFLNGGQTLSMGWTPEKGFLEARWDHYCELLMLYLLGMGSPTHPLPPQTWDAFRRPRVQYAGYDYISGAPTLFTHQYSHAWFDFRGRRDAYADYYANSVKATMAHRAFCIDLSSQFPSYAQDLWGITASDSANGYVAWGGPPKDGPIDGSIVPCAAGGSIPFAPTETITVLRTIKGMYPGAWGRYGFTDAFNPLTGWYGKDVIGIDVGILLLMAENYRSGFVWRTFMQDPVVQRGMQLAGFR